MPEGKVFHGGEYRGEWKFVDDDWSSKWTWRQRQGHWLRTRAGGVKQVLHWLPASNQDTNPCGEPESANTEKPT